MAPRTELHLRTPQTARRTAQQRAAATFTGRGFNYVITILRRRETVRRRLGDVVPVASEPLLWQLLFKAREYKQFRNDTVQLILRETLRYRRVLATIVREFRRLERL